MTHAILERISDGATDLVFELIEGGVSAHTASVHGVSLMQWCAHYGDVSAIKFLLRNGGSLQSLGENLDLHGAAFHGHPRLCQFLIEQGANVDHALADTGESPLHSALCSVDRKDRDLVLKMLITHGANPNCTTKPSVETDAFMRDIRTRGETPLHRAAAFGNEETIQMLLDAGARVDVKDMNGDSPLTWASWHLRPRPILRLLCYGQYRA